MSTKVHITSSKDNSTGLMIGHDNCLLKYKNVCLIDVDIPNFSNELRYLLNALEFYTTSWLLLREILFITCLPLCK